MWQGSSGRGGYGETLEGYFELEKLGSLAVKGRSEKVTVDTLA